MADVSRYQRQGLFAEYGSVRTYQGVDPVTGLPVLIYQFLGRPMLGVGDLESENIPGVLASSFDGRQGQLVVAYARGYLPVTAPLTGEQLKPLLLGSARALRDGAEAGVIHGDIQPARFLTADGHVLLEGYGVRWDEVSKEFRAPEYGGEGSYAGDVYSWARAIKHLLGGRVPKGMGPLLERCLSPRPEARPPAGEVYEGVLACSAPSARQTGFDIDLGADDDDAYAAFAGSARDDAAPAGSEQAGAQRRQKPVLPREPLRADEDEQPRLLRRRSVPSSPESSDPGFVKNLPPGAKYRSGDELEAMAPGVYREPEPISFDPPRRNSRRLILLTALLIGAAVLGGLAFWQQGATGLIAPQNRSETLYIVDVSVEPSDMRYVSVLVVESPPGSERRAGDIIGTLTLSDPPDSIILDQAGLWQLRARAQDRLSQVVSLSVPQERSIVFELPEVSGEMQP